MKSRINLVVLTPGFAADENDSTAIPSLQLYLRHLQICNPEITVQVLAVHYPIKKGNYKWSGIPVYSSGGRGKHFNRIFTWMKILFRLFKLRKNNQADLIHAFWLSETALIGLLFRWFSGIPVLITAMGQDVKPGNRYLRILHRFALNITFISQFQANFITGITKTKSQHIIPFGVEPILFKSSQKVRTTDIIGVGSINRVKNYGVFVEIISQIVKQFPAIKCKIIGDGEGMDGIEQKIREEGLEKNITLTGKLSYVKVIEEMQSSKILLHTSTFEGQGLVITEALAAGLKVVCYPVGIAPQIVSEKLFIDTTKEGLENHLMNILFSNEENYKPEIHNTISDTCSEYYKIYTDLANRK